MGDPRPFAEGERVLLRRKESDSFIVRLRNEPQAIEGRGVLDLSSVIGKPPGTAIEWAGRSYLVLRPTLPDLMAGLRRKAQIVTPKDAQFLLFLTGIGPGDQVGEAGAGSGALTLVLAHSVGPTGRVHSFDRRADFLAVARGNLEWAGLADRVEFGERDVAHAGWPVQNLDAIVLDLAEPWACLPGAREALAVGGRIATYTPTYNQLERTVRELRQLGFEEVRSVELLERALHVGEGGTRPEFEMLGHTGFLTGARRVS